MTDYRRNFIAGGSFFFTVNLAERRLRLLTEHMGERISDSRVAKGERGTGSGATGSIPFAMKAIPRVTSTTFISTRSSMGM
jgi:putative transposase